MKNKSSHSAVIYTPGRWTENSFLFKDGLSYSIPEKISVLFSLTCS